MQKSDPINFIILAAGKGTRMYSDIPKVMHKICGIEMIKHICIKISKFSNKKINIVVSEDSKLIKNLFKSEKDVSFSLQKERLGTGHAVKSAINAISSKGVSIILYGDSPFVEKSTIDKLITRISSGSKVTIVGFDYEYENKYGRLEVEPNGDLKSIIEFNDANEEQRKIKLCNSGVMAIDNAYLHELLSEINNDNNKGEYYLTDIVAIANQKNLKIDYVKSNYEQLQGINNKLELANAEKYMKKSINENLLAEGVTLIDPDSCYIEQGVKIGKDVVIEPNVIIKNKVIISDNVTIKAFSYLEDCKIDAGTSIGPFAMIRGGAEIGKDSSIGKFVEIKKSKIGNKTKINHLSYIGDSQIKNNVNIGAGTITCNYDGFKKYKTKIDDNSFIGSNTAFIAPVKVGKGAVVGAGSVIVSDIPDNSVTIARSKQVDLLNAAQKYRKNKEKKS
jgi:bifunctional UDP-N-acetylglucosamine pyrophosphorylase / glucosamine-1-phosphate N-acetyltransferase